MNATDLVNRTINIRKDYGTVVAMLGFAVMLRVKDERILEIARSLVSKLDKRDYAPDWVHCLANASHVDAVDDAWDDMSVEMGLSR